MPHAPLGVFDIPLVAGNDVNMDVVDALSGRGPHVYADIVAIGLEFLVDALLFLTDQLHADGNLFGSQFKKAGDMAFRDHYRVTGADRVGITRAVRNVSIQGQPLRVCAEQARVVGVSLFYRFFF